MYFIVITTLISFVQSQPNNNTTPTYVEAFNLVRDINCAATIVQKLQFQNYLKYLESFRFEFINGTCNNPTLWYSYYPIYYDGISSDYTFNSIFGDDDESTELNVSCKTNSLCSEFTFCLSNYPVTVTNYTAAILEFETVKTEYVSSGTCSTSISGTNSHSNDEFISLVTVLCGDYNFTTLLTEEDFLEDIMADEIEQCGTGNKPNPYLSIIFDYNYTWTTTEDIDVIDIDTEPICTINHSSDNWITWIYFAVSFVVVSISLYVYMTRNVGIQITIKKWGAILILFMSSLAIASIFRALITTFVVMANYEKCNTLQSKAPLTPWDWEKDWEADSSMGFWFWIIGVLVSSIIYAIILMMKFNMRLVSQYRFGKIDCGEKCIGWCVKGLLFIVTFSFSAVLRPYYYVGRHSEWGSKCACVDGHIALIAEIYGAALLSIVFAPCAYKLGYHCLTDDDDNDDGDDKDKDNTVTNLIGCALMVYAAYCALIVITSPFLFIVFRIIEYVESAEDFFTSDDFTLFIWFFEAVSNCFVDLNN